MRLLAALLFALVFAVSPSLADSYTLTIATEAGVGITKPQSWAQRLAEADISNVRIRGARAGEQPDIEETAAGASKVYRVTGVLTSRDKLVLPGEQFELRDAARLRDYLERLLADGAESMTAVRGTFGLTKEQFEQAFKQLGRPVSFATKQRPLAELLARVEQQSGMKVDLPPSLPATTARLACQDKLIPLSLGCGLAVALKAEGLAFAPEKPRGKPVQLAVRFANELKEPWPIGWPTKRKPSELAPAIFKRINVEIDGFTLQEAIDAIAPRIEVPFFWDRGALAAARIDPGQIQVKLARGNMPYSRILDKLLFQTRLHGELRVDEAGTVFYWATR